jgi:hypothetical protein
MNKILIALHQSDNYAVCLNLESDKNFTRREQNNVDTQHQQSALLGDKYVFGTLEQGL